MSVNCKEGYRTALRQTERDRMVDKDILLDRYRKIEVYETDIKSEYR